MGEVCVVMALQNKAFYNATNTGNYSVAVVIAFQNKAFYNTLIGKYILPLVVIAFQNKAFYNHTDILLYIRQL